MYSRGKKKRSSHRLVFFLNATKLLRCWKEYAQRIFQNWRFKKTYHSCNRSFDRIVTYCNDNSRTYLEYQGFEMAAFDSIQLHCHVCFLFLDTF